MANAFVGSEIGALKVVNFLNDTFQNANHAERLNTEKKIECMCWRNDDQTSLLCCLANRQVKVYDCAKGTYETLFTCEGGSGEINGVGLLNKDIVTCVTSGELKVFSSDGVEKLCTMVGENINRMRLNPKIPNMVATGGRENDLKVRDLNNPQKPIFIAKNVPHDELNLRIPVWIRDLRFVDDNVVATCTAHYQIRGYDLRSGRRRPFVDIKFGDHPITAIACWKDRHNYFSYLLPFVQLSNDGLCAGELGLFDLKTGRLVCTYKGFAGGIRCVECHETEPCVATCGLDRFVRLHHVQTRKMLNKIYCKSRLTSMLLSRTSILTSPDDLLSVKSEPESDDDSDSSQEGRTNEHRKRMKA
ncbi:unnamed protein product [Soboliphyme baturini]|uniref:WD repeat-containing protein 74 n=1 Tax=Soboliphyme baturini TaxID=241478 RepID=A0A183IU40_9BILA|nr:unnamed protein product [Soboliphyme baturini]